MISIVLADDHKLIRECVASLLNKEPDLKVVSQCSNGLQLVERVEKLKPKVAIVDVAMPELNGFDAVKHIRTTSPGTKVIVLSAHSEEPYIRSMLEAGISGYVVKSSAFTDLVKAIRRGTVRRVYFSKDIAEAAISIQGRSSRRKTDEDGDEADLLSPRERTVLQLIAEGSTSRQIAEKLSISETTVKTHRNHLMDKLNVRDIAGLTLQAVRLRLVSIE